MDKSLRNRIQLATQKARARLEIDVAEQLEGRFDIRPDGSIGAEAPSQLNDSEHVVRAKLLAAVAHFRGGGLDPAEAVAAYLREAAFTTLNRFVALKMLEARGLVKECISRGPESAGFGEYGGLGLAPGLASLPDRGYCLYLESLFDEIACEVGVLFDRSDPASLLWPRTQTLTELLDTLNDHELADAWQEDETIGWVYQYFNSDDERSRMRAASQAPRNSRELAVRNQFFTPRYVVEFLTDNTLGRTWYEMRRGETVLTERCQYLVYSGSASDARRQSRDPRDLKILDPACGSGHFLLYAFDLLETMYEEAWNDEDSPVSEVTGMSLRADYPNRLALITAVPGLILRHNLHGIEIDARCAQIAGLALWMRAQRAYAEAGVASASRPAIVRTNVVVAEPMPGEPKLRAEFFAGLDSKLREFVERIFVQMEMAGEAGSLLRIEEEIDLAVREVYGETGGLFAQEDEQRWHEAEADLLKALHDYTARAGSNDSYARQLFSDDAARGLAFIDLCRQRYDVVLMNPPFGLPTTTIKGWLKSSYPETWKNMYAAFAERGLSLSMGNGWLGAITPTMWLYSRQLRGFRRQLLDRGSPRLFAELGNGVMDQAAVEACLWTASPTESQGVATFIDLLEAPVEERPGALREPGRQRQISPRQFDLVAESPLCHHLEPQLLHLWEEPDRLAQVAEIAQGNTTFDDFRFLRAWWEVFSDSIRFGGEWMTRRAGGDYAPFCASSPLVIRWSNNGAECRAHGYARHGSDAQVMQSSKFWGAPGLSHPNVATAGFGVRAAAAGECFSVRSVFICVTDSDLRMATLGVLNAPCVMRLYQAHGRHRSHEPIAMKDLPIGRSQLESMREAVGEPALRAWSAAVWADRLDETSRLFVGLPSALGEILALPEFISLQREIVRDATHQIDREVRRVLGLPSEIQGIDTLDNWNWRATEPSVFRDLLSEVVGQVFGRFAQRVDADMLPTEQGPFDEMPAQSPAMIAAFDGIDVAVDDEGASGDLAAEVWTSLERLGMFDRGGPPEEWGPRSLEEIRDYFRKSFFDDHLVRYSRTGRKAPIYWQLATPSASYSVWLYYPRLTKDSLYRLLNDYVAPKLQHEERKQYQLVRSAGPSPAASQRAEIDDQGVRVEELRVFRDELARVAPLWNPSQDDGVMINFAPLWRLVPQHRVWQRECRACWDTLLAGDYDWAHLAMRFWPERVVPKCAGDRSLAIAHGLETDFWQETPDGKWRAREVDSETVDALVVERSSLATKDALANLTAAPAPTGGKRGRAKPRAS